MTNDKVIMKGYKGYNKGLVCRGKQYAENTVFEENEAKICKSGIHFCENPLDVLDYYGFVNDNGDLNEFTEVEALDDVLTDDNKKFCTKKIKIGKKLSITEFVNDAVNFILSKSNLKDLSATNTGYKSTATNTGYKSTATNTGYKSTATNTGNRSAATNTGDYSAATNTGDYSAATNTGDYSAATNTGSYSVATNSGFQSAATNTGSYSVATNSGFQSAATVEGKESFAIAIGADSKAKGKLGCYIAVAEWGQDKNGIYHIVNFKSHKVDGKVIKEDTFYTLKNGKFVEYK